MLTDTGLQMFLKAFASGQLKGQVGTDNTIPTTGDTNLISPLADSLADVNEANVNGNLLTVVYELRIDQSNGNDIKEAGLFYVDGTENKLISRFIYPTIQKNENLSVLFKIEYEVDRK